MSFGSRIDLRSYGTSTRECNECTAIVYQQTLCTPSNIMVVEEMSYIPGST